MLLLFFERINDMRKADDTVFVQKVRQKFLKKNIPTQYSRHFIGYIPVCSYF